MRISPLAVSIGAAVLLSACGPEAQVNTDANGAMEISNSEGTVSTGHSLPSDWPSDAPTYPNAVVQYSASVNPTTGRPGTAAVFTSTASMKDVKAFYNAQLTANGWTSQGTLEADETILMSATKDTRTLSLAIGGIDGQVSITMGIETK